MVAFRLEKTLRGNLFKADGALTVVTMPVAPRAVLAWSTGQRKTLAARHFWPKFGFLNLGFTKTHFLGLGLTPEEID